MSNNKQSMKLYTEEELTRYLLDEGIMELSDLANNLIPHIQLPSDEEIGQEFKHGSENWEVRQALEVGAKWMRDKIQGGNNEQR